MSKDLDWTDDVIDRLRSFWAEGLSTAEIGRRMGLSKNAIVGKAHRLDLPPRPSPIRRSSETASMPPRPRRIKSTPTLPSLAAAAPSEGLQACKAPVVAERPAVAVPTRPKPAMRDNLDRQCCWPIGEPGTPGFRYCDDPAHGRGPYCAKHSEIAHVRRPERSDALMKAAE